MDIKVEIKSLDNKKQVFIEGEIDVYTAQKLKETLHPLAEGENPHVIINLEHVSYMDSTGLGVFIGFLKLIRKKDGQLSLVQLSERLERLFRITGLNDIIDISSKSEGEVQ
ncbi:STAS domain-containing protein [Metabacillus malikii]|uniref:Anti-sigma factor antagonist n=1 Tax=Metabacillus malikii TaxID=1504265 RepID=A0ABT9ZMY7_9BACI|nr:STAS domain-containing protein [Metabacillus malikii]MDQ0233609.1 anti-sigma B factor antagonist [Metabacillus malikii]